MSDSTSSILLNRQSTIDNRQDKYLKQSIIDYQLNNLRVLLQDNELGAGLVAQALKTLGEGQVNSIADYAVRKGSHKGKLFVSICNKAIREKTR